MENPLQRPREVQTESFLRDDLVLAAHKLKQSASELRRALSECQGTQPLLTHLVYLPNQSFLLDLLTC